MKYLHYVIKECEFYKSFSHSTQQQKSSPAKLSVCTLPSPSTHAPLLARQRCLPVAARTAEAPCWCGRVRLCGIASTPCTGAGTFMGTMQTSSARGGGSTAGSEMWAGGIFPSMAGPDCASDVSFPLREFELMRISGVLTVCRGVCAA